MKNKKSTILRRLFFSYLCLLIPWIFCSSILTYAAMDRMKSGTNRAVSYQLSRVREAFESRRASLRDSAVLLASQPELLRFKMLSDHVSASKGIKRLEILNAYDPDSLDIFFSYGTGKIYSSRGMTRNEAYFSSVLGCTQGSAEIGQGLLSKREEAVAYLEREAGGYGYLIYHFPVRGSEDTSVNFCLDFSILGRMLTPLVNEHPAQVRLTFSDGRALSFYGTLSDGMRLLQSPETREPDAFTMLSADFPGYRALLEVRYRSYDLYRSVYLLLALNSLLTAVVLCVSIWVSYVQSKRHYVPIRQLATTARAIAPNSFGPEGEKGDEFDFINRMLGRIAEESGKMEQSAEESRKILKNQTALLLFQGLLKDEAAAQQMLRLCGTERNENFYALLGVTFPTALEGPFMEKLKAMLAGDLFLETTVNGKNAVVILIELSHKDYLRRSRTQIAEELFKVFKLLGAGETRGGYSQVYESLSMAPYAYLEAVGSLTKPDKPVVFWENAIEKGPGGIRLPEEEVSAFEAALEERDFTRASNLFGRFQASLSAEGLSEEGRRYLRCCILQMVILRIKNGKTDAEPDWMEEALGISPFDGESFQANMTDLIKKLCRPMESAADLEKAVRYIEENYQKYDLSLDEVAAYAGFAKTYLSRLFKQKTGERYIDYLTKLRMEKARELLANKALSIREIVAMAGYNDIPGFRKKFKALYGVNAAEYRNQLDGPQSPEDQGERKEGYPAK